MYDEEIKPTPLQYPLPLGGVPRTQKLRFLPGGNQGLSKVNLLFTHGLGQTIALHASLADRISIPTYLYLIFAVKVHSKKIP